MFDVNMDSETAAAASASLPTVPTNPGAETPLGRAFLTRLLREGIESPEPKGLLVESSQEDSWNTKVASFIAGRERLGRRVKLREQDCSNGDPYPIKEVQAEMTRIREQVAESPSGFQLKKAQIQIDVLDVTTRLALALTSHKPSVVQVVAALAMHPRMGGLDGERLGDALAHMQNRYRNQRGNFEVPKPWVGQPRPFLEAIVWNSNVDKPVNLTLGALDQLHMARGEMLTTKEIASNLQLGYLGRDVEHRLNAGLQVLSLVGLARKHPYHRDEQVQQPVMPWSSKAYWPIKRGITNPQFVILEALHLQPTFLQQLHRPASTVNGNPDADFSSSIIIDTAWKLQEQGLIELHRVVGNRGRLLLEGHITEKGRKLIGEYATTNVGDPLQSFNSERLRLLLLTGS